MIFKEDKQRSREYGRRGFRAMPKYRFCPDCCMRIRTLGAYAKAHKKVCAKKPVSFS